jgi:parvulin-like peptidyl-prolyl isomerase
MTAKQLKDFATRKLKIERFKQARWDEQLETYFLARKRQLDRVVYSLIQTDELTAQELYFRIKEGEASFAELARQYSQGQEAKIGGLIGPVELGSCPPMLAKMLYGSYPGQLFPPIRMGNLSVIVRLEQSLSAQLDNARREQLKSELFAAWLQERLNSVTYSYSVGSSPTSAIAIS